MAPSTAVVRWSAGPLLDDIRSPSKRRRVSTIQDEEDIHLMLQWASNANVRSGWELFSKLKNHGVNASTHALSEELAHALAPSTAHYAVADNLAKEAILNTLEQRRRLREKPSVQVHQLAGVSEQTTGWANLPIDVAIQIVEKMDAGSVHRAACVCVLYKDVIGCVISGLSFDWCHAEGREINAVVCGAATLFPCLKSVNLHRHVALQDSSICKLLAANANTLQRLDLSGCNRITDVALQAIVKHCRGLQSLDVSSCTKLSNSIFVKLGKACPDLMTLNACGCAHLADTGLMALSIHCNGLREINLGWCHQVSDFGIICLARGCPGLQVVDLCGCHRLGDQAISALAIGCKNMKSLGLHCLRHITDVAMVCLATNLKSLCSLNVSGCIQLGEEAVQAVLKSCPGLHTCASRRSVIVSGCVGLSSIHCPCRKFRNNA